MPRPQRLNLPNIPQHVTQRGNNRQQCFFDDSDRYRYLAILESAACRRGCAVHAYVLMTNHVHLLVTPTSPDGVSKLMQDIGREYVRHINKTRKRTGTLWEGRFKSSLVDSESYCLVCHRYIELNPVRAGMVDDPANYPWSSYSANALGMVNSLLTPHELWLSLGSDGNSRCREYRALFSERLPEAVLEEIRHDNCKGLPLGRASFKAWLESQLQIKLGTGKVGRPSNTT